MQVTPYLFFGGRCEEALAFYETVFPATRGQTMLFRDVPEPMPEGMLPPDWDGKIMHAELQIGDTQVFASDGVRAEQKERNGLSLAVRLGSAGEVDRVFEALSEGGAVEMPLAKTFFAERFGGVADRFGVSWMIIAE